MILTKEQFVGLSNAFGPCTNYYECMDLNAANEDAAEFDTLSEYADFALSIESVWLDSERGACAGEVEACIKRVRDFIEGPKFMKCNICDYRITNTEWHLLVADIGCPKCKNSLFNYSLVTE